MQAGRAIDQEELAAMVKRGEDLLNTGDIASARLLLRRAAEARDARAAFALGGTYDPIVLKRLGAYGSTPDVAAARDWYEKARQYGSREAPQRLELLASQYR
jgi:TPR repeat protein